MIPLSQLSVGQRAFVSKIEGDNQLTRRLLSLGIRVGCELEVVQWRPSGVVLANANNRVALSGNLVPSLIMSTDASN